MRFPSSALLAALLATSSLAYAQTRAGQAAPAAGKASGTTTAAVNRDRVIATVNGQKITERDMDIAYSNLSEQARQQTQQQIVNELLNELINEKAIDIEARKEKLDQNPDVKAAMAAAADQVLQNALLRQVILPQLSDANIQAVYQAQYASKPQQEVHAEHILVKTQAEAQAIIDQLNKGADFATLAKAKSTDPNASDGGDLGWFKRGDMVPAFSNAAFALKPGTYTKTPVQSPYGWHVIKVLAVRTAQPQTLAEVHDTIAQQLQQQALQQELEKLRGGVKVVIYDQNGKPIPQTGAPAAGARK